MFDGYHDMWGMHWGWWFFWIALIIIAAWSMVSGRVIRTYGRGAPQPPSRETPLDMLQRRYAAGEMSTEEYQERKAQLEENT